LGQVREPVPGGRVRGEWRFERFVERSRRDGFELWRSRWSRCGLGRPNVAEEQEVRPTRSRS
ncbi:hypothetical protein, partial [Bradyrhizobium neotropicale]|uniref:hypothetical protein n=1 Tax=Bradyrhizobium neotropicale TaxID=1497615 RepID=UPI001AD7719A